MDSFSDLHGVSLKVFESISRSTTYFLLPLFLFRIVFSNITGEGAKAFAIIKGALIYFCLVSGFPIIIEILFSIPDQYLPKYDSLNSLTTNSPEVSAASIIPFALDRVVEVILSALYWVVYYLHVFFMLLMCSMAPIVFLLSTILGVGLGVEIFFGLLIVGSSWPIIWYGFDQVHASLVSAQTDAFGAKCLELIVTLFKGFSPVAFAALAIKSPAGRVITQAAQSTISASKWAYTKSTGRGFSQASTTLYSRTQQKDQSFNRENQRNFEKQNTKKSIYEGADRLQKAQHEQKQNLKESKNENTQSRDI